MIECFIHHLLQQIPNYPPRKFKNLNTISQLYPQTRGAGSVEQLKNLNLLLKSLSFAGIRKHPSWFRDNVSPCSQGLNTQHTVTALDAPRLQVVTGMEVTHWGDLIIKSHGFFIWPCMSTNNFSQNSCRTVWNLRLIMQIFFFTLITHN